MEKERKTLVAIPLCVLGLYALSFTAFNWQQKHDLKEQRTDIPDKRNLEVHHIEPLYRGGTDDIENGEAVTRPEHAFEHYKLADEATNKRDREANLWAVRQIVKRMTPSERKEFNDMIR